MFMMADATLLLFYSWKSRRQSKNKTYPNFHAAYGTHSGSLGCMLKTRISGGAAESILRGP